MRYLTAVILCLLGVPAEAQEVIFRDDFEGQTLAEGWVWQPSSKGETSFSLTSHRGCLTLRNFHGGFFWGQDTTAPTVSRPVPTHNLSVTAKLVRYRPDQEWQEAGILLRQDQANWFKFQKAFNGQTCQLDCAGVVEGREKEFRTPRFEPSDIFFRFEKKDDQYFFLYSRDGRNFVELGAISAAKYTQPQVGFFASFYQYTRPNEAQFDFLEIRRLPDDAIQRGNLIPNPSFEAGQEDTPTAWKRVNTPASTLTWEQPGRTGARCAAIENNSGMWEIWETEVHGVKPNRDYHLVVWAKATERSLLQVLVFGHDLYFRPGVMEWARYEVDVNSKEHHGTCKFQILSEGQRHKAWIDDVELVGATTSSLPETIPLSQFAQVGQTALADRAVNLIPHGGCETDTDKDGIPDGWHHSNPRFQARAASGGLFFDPGLEKARYSWVRKGFKSQRCVAVEVREPNKWGMWSLEVKGIKKYTDYALQFSYYQPERGVLRFSLFGLLFTAPHARGFEQWLFHSVNVNSGEVEGDTVLSFALENPKKVGRILIDEVELYEGTVEHIGTTDWLYNRFLGQNEARLTYFTYEEAHISPDLPSPVRMGLEFRFTKQRPPHLEMILDLPPQVKLADYEARYWSSVREQCQLTSAPVSREGQPYTRHTLLFPVNRAEFTHPTHPGLKNVTWYLATPEPQGVFDAYFSMRWQGGEQKEQRLPLRVIRIPEAPKLKHFKVMEDVDPVELEHWPGALDNLRRIGVTHIMYRNSAPLTGQGLDEALKVIGQLRRGLFVVADWFNLGDAYRDRTDAPPIGLDGQPVKDHVPCFTKRTASFAKAVENAKKYVDAGVTGFFFDDEGDTNCFCDDCLAAFQTYLGQHALEVAYQDPREFEKDPTAHPILHRHWYEFGRWTYANAVLDLRKELVAHLRAQNQPPDSLFLHDGGIFIELHGLERLREKHPYPEPGWLYQTYAEAFDYYGEQIYLNCYDWGYLGLPNRGGDQQAKNSRVLRPHGVKQFPLPGADLTYMDPMDDFQPHQVMKYQLMELCAAGIGGFYVYPFRDVDVADMMYINQALRLIAPVEEVVVNGTPTDLPKIVKGEANVRGLEYGRELILLVSNYSTMEAKPVEVTVECRVSSECQVLDLEKGKAIARIGPRRPRFSVRLGEERARMFHVRGSVSRGMAGNKAGSGG